MKLKLGIIFCNSKNERFFGEGPYRLLQEIDNRGSLRAAAQAMKMAYTKAFTLIKRAEAELGFSLTQRKIGGKGGGGSELTPDAKELLKRYEAYKISCEQMAEGLYNKHFSGFGPKKLDIDGQ